MNQVATDSRLQAIVQKIISIYQPEKIILFGSLAWGSPESESDVDLLIVKKSDKPRIEREQELRSLLFPAGLPIDIFVYTPAELERSIKEDRNLFLEDIIQNGISLYGDN